MTPFAVRRATIDDAAPIAAVHVATWRDAYAGLMPDEFLAGLDVDAWAERNRQRMAEPGPFRTLVAEDLSGTIVGFVRYGPYRYDTGAVDESAGEINAVYVHPDHQGTGVGRALMDAAADDLAGRGMTELRLWVLEENQASREFYERYGLTPDGVRDTFRLDPAGTAAIELPEVRYAMPLGR